MALLSLPGASPAFAQTFPITFDATALDATRFNVDFKSDFANEVTVLQVQPGTHNFCAPASADCFQFSVLNDGTLAFASELDAYVAGRGTNILVVTGFPVNIDATALDAIHFNVNFSTVGGLLSNVATTLQVLPGRYTFCAPASRDCFQFSVLHDGTLAFAPELAAYVAGQGTNTLVVTGLPVHFDATALDAVHFNVNFSGVGGLLANAVTTLQVLPGPYTFCAPASADCFQFSILNNGTVTYDAGLDAFVGGRGTTTLTVVGFPITIDATARGAVGFNLNFGSVGGSSFPNVVTTFQLLPGLYTFCAPASTSCFQFNATNAGMVDYAQAFDDCLAGRGTSRLTILCDPNAPNRSPVCQFAQATPHVLWPPNHQMRAVTITGIADPDDDAVDLAIVTIAQNEPVNGFGDGDTSPDAVLQGGELLLRAERNASGSGRIYEIGFTATDSHGATCVGKVTVVVPINLKP